MENRVPTKPGRIKLTDDSGNVKYYYMERADEPTVEGTPLNKATLFDSENESRYACGLPNDALKMLTKELLPKIKRLESWNLKYAFYWCKLINFMKYYQRIIKYLK